MALAAMTLRRWRAVSAGALLLGLVACEDSGMPVCTGEFAVVTVKVLAPGGDPLEHATTVATVVRTGEVLEPTTLMLLEPGVYAVADDSHLPKIRVGGERVRFQATAAPFFATGEFTIRSMSGCHVSKSSGPDTILATYMED